MTPLATGLGAGRTWYTRGATAILKCDANNRLLNRDLTLHAKKGVGTVLVLGPDRSRRDFPFFLVWAATCRAVKEYGVNGDWKLR
jgi:hypothetical protein